MRAVSCCRCVSVAVVLFLVSAMADPLPAERIEARSATNVETVQPTKEPESQEVTKARDLFSQSRFEEALAVLQPLTRSNRDLAPAEIFLAQWALQAKQPALARTWLDRATKSSPDDPEAYVVLAHMNAAELRWTEASLLFNRAAELVAGLSGSKRELPTQLRLLAGRAAVAEAGENWKDAEKFLIDLIAKQETPSGAAWQSLGRALFRQGRCDEALEKLRKAAEINPELLTPEAILSAWYQQTGDQQNAEKWIKTALEQAPNRADTRLAAAESLIRNEQFDAAIEQVDAALQLAPESLEAKLLRGNVALFLEDYEKATQFLQQAALQSPGNFPATNNLALALCEGTAAQQQRALEYAELNARQFAKQPQSLGTLGWVLYRSGRVNEAESVLQKAVASGIKTPELSYYLAQVLADRGKQDDAKRLLHATLDDTSDMFFGRPKAKRLLEKLDGQSQE